MNRSPGEEQPHHSTSKLGFKVKSEGTNLIKDYLSNMFEAKNPPIPTDDK